MEMSDGNIPMRSLDKDTFESEEYDDRSFNLENKVNSEALHMHQLPVDAPQRPNPFDTYYPRRDDIEANRGAAQ